MRDRMITTPTITGTASTIVTSAQAQKAQAIIIQVPSGGGDIALKFDGSTDALTYANGLITPAGTERTIDSETIEYHNAVQAITSGASVTIRVHVIEG